MNKRCLLPVFLAAALFSGACSTSSKSTLTKNTFYDQNYATSSSEAVNRFIASDDASTDAMAPEEFVADAHDLVMDGVAPTIAALDTASDQDLTLALHNEAERVSAFLHDEKDMSADQAKLLNDYHSHLLEMSALAPTEKKHRLREGLKAFAHGSWLGISVAGQTMAYGANMIDLTVTMPVRIPFRFIRGLVTGVGERPYAGVWTKGVQGDVGYAGGMMLYYSGYFFATGNPVLGVLFVSPVVDYIATAACQVPHKNARTVRFCGHYNEMKLKADKIAGIGDAGGAVVYRGVAKLLKVRYRHPDRVDAGVCANKEKKQLRQAYRTIRQRVSVSTRSRIGKIGIGTAMLSSEEHPLGKACVGISVWGEEREVTRAHILLGDVLDGIAVKYTN